MTRKIKIIGVPLDLGQGRRGVDVDPSFAPGVGTPVPGGISYREAHLAMEMIADSGKMISLELVEVNPVIDSANKTAILGVELALSALGKKIL
jgi:arginase